MKIVALVTVYYPNDAVAVNVDKINKQVSKVIILDNTPFVNNSEKFNGPNITYISNSSNLGLSKAFNIGLKSQEFTSDDYIIFFDQDSLVPSGHVETLLRDFVLVSRKYKIGCIGPLFYDNNSKVQISNNDSIELSANIFSVKTIITSSLLIKYSVLEDVGFWNESIFLDYADWDLCWKIIENGYRVCLSSNTVLSHNLGDSSDGISISWLPRYNEVRGYYKIRDALKMIRYSYVPLKYKIKFIYLFSFEPLIYLILFPNRLKRLINVFKGLRDGFLRREGELR